MYTDLSTSTVQFGQSIPTDGLIIYYDLSNFASYDGADTKITNLVRAYPNYSGSLFGNPTYTPAGAQSYLTLNKASTQYVKFTLGTFGPDYTSVAVVASTGTTWDGNGYIVGGVLDQNADNAAGTTNCFVSQRAIGNVNVSVGDYYYSFGSYIARVGTVLTTSNINTPHLYYYGADLISYVVGYDNTTSFGSVGLFNRGATTGANGYIGRTDPFPPIGSSDYVSMKLYLYMLYNRKITAAEAAALYQFTKSRFSLS